MEESRDPVIKLFGKTIQLRLVREILVAAGEDSGEYVKKSPSNKQDSHEAKHKNEETRVLQEEEKIDEKKLSEANEEMANGQQNKKTDSPIDKSLKKPDIILPCPRCNSMDTKFCYFNNYNVNQPRHFCKKCQRYWTEGGSMRNVRVGAGRRKSKSATENHHYCHHITIPDCAQADFSESINDEDKSSRSLAATLNSNDEGNKAFNSDFLAFGHVNGAPWPNPWSHTPLYPVTTYLSVPWLCSGLNSTGLGKRSREGNIMNHINSSEKDFTKSEKCFWIPKTVKVDDHEKAAKYSLWEKLGFKSDKPEGVLKNRSTEASTVLCANPAALSRSLIFQERS